MLPLCFIGYSGHALKEPIEDNEVRLRLIDQITPRIITAIPLFVFNNKIEDNKPMRILGIETSCDETGIAIYDGDRGLLAHALHSQIDIHRQYGGVIPELASRDHIRKITPLMHEALEQAHCDLASIDAIAYTAGPGLMGALLIGASFAKSLALALDKPSIAVHHMEAHLLAPLLEESAPTFPFLALIVSGGHTLLVHVKSLGDYDLLGQSIDDAAGEAFDKTAKILGLPYPGGPYLAKLAKAGDPKRFRFPRPMTDRPGLDFSFSGLKTFALNTFNQNPKDDKTKAAIARAFEDAVVDTMLIKCRRALEQTGLKCLVLAGGVAANEQLRASLGQFAQSKGIDLFYPAKEFCTDNGAMVALTGYLRFKAGFKDDDLTIFTKARWGL